jgi:aryl-alcohol dehydrogenase-like predicted oxidoreductase
MRYKLFGRSGLKVSELALGAMTFGEVWGWGANEADSRAVFDSFAEAGGTFIDTAHFYTEGLSETMLGKFIEKDRDHFVIATKYTPTASGDVSKSGNCRKNMRLSLEQSLRRLNTDHVDLFMPHWWDDTTPIDEVMRGLDDLVSAGKVLYVSISDTPAWQIARANMLADLRGFAPFIGVQLSYSLLERTAERDLLPMAQALDLGVTAWSPLASGVLSGKYNGVAQPNGRRTQPLTAREAEIAGLVTGIAQEIGHTPSQVALAAIRQLNKSVIPILGARSKAQLDDNMGCLGLVLNEDHMARLTQATAPSLGFPHNMLTSSRARQNASGGHYDGIDNRRS